MIERDCMPATSFQRALKVEEQMKRERESGERPSKAELDDGLQRAMDEPDFGLEREVKSWSGFLRPRLRGDSVYELLEHQFVDSKSGVEQHGEYEDGYDLMAEGKEDHENVLDLCRHQAERCGSIAQWKLMVDVEGLFGGIGVRTTDMLLDNGLASRNSIFSCSFSSSPTETINVGLSLSLSLSL